MSRPILDRLTFDDGPVPAPQPVVVVPSAPAQPSRLTVANLKQFAPWVIVLAFAVGFAWEHYKSKPLPGPGPSPVVDATDAGKAWAKELPLTFADSFEKAQADVRGSDKTLDAIRKEHVERWKATRDEAFNNRFEKMFDAVIPPGNDKPSMEDRRRYAEVIGQIITGTRQGAK